MATKNLELKVFKIPVTNPKIWESYNIFKEYCKQYHPEIKGITQLSQQPWKPNGKPWLSHAEVFGKQLGKYREFQRETLIQGEVIIAATIKKEKYNG